MIVDLVTNFSHKIKIYLKRKQFVSIYKNSGKSSFITFLYPRRKTTLKVDY